MIGFSTVGKNKPLIRAGRAAAICILALAAPVEARGQETVPAPTLQPGDAVRIEVWRQPELSGEFMIGEDGHIEHPLYRVISVRGLDFASAEARIGELLSRYESQPQFVIQPLLKVSVGGEVRQPSLYRLPPTTSIAEAIALAGGATERGQLDQVRLFRGGREVEVDLTLPEAGLAQQPVRSGDQIYVNRRVSIFRDYIAPAGGILAAVAAIVNFATRN